MSFQSLLAQAEDTLNRALFLLNNHITVLNHVSKPSIHIKAIAHDMQEIKLNIDHALKALTLIREPKERSQVLVLLDSKTSGNKKAD